MKSAYKRKHISPNSLTGTRKKRSARHVRGGTARYGYTLREEHRKKMSIANKERKPTEKTKKKISRVEKGKKGPNYGRKFSEETRRRMSKAQKKWWKEKKSKK